MACCLGGTFIPLVLDPCTGEIRTLGHGEQLRIGDTLVGGTPGTPVTSGTIITVTSNTTLTEDTIVLADASSAALTVTLPAGTEGMRCVVKKIDSTSNDVTVDGNGAETIDEQLTAVTNVQYTALTFVFHVSEWWIV